MTYTLAEQLKDAGFPQAHKFFAISGGLVVCFCGARNTEEPHRPDLSQLIEACGDGFAILMRADEGFEAYSETNWGNTPDGIKALASRSDEAVAKLWLALQEKPKTQTV